MSLPYHKVDWELVAEVRRTQGRVGELEKQVRELQRLVSAALAAEPGALPPPVPIEIRHDPEPPSIWARLTKWVRS